MSEDYIRGEMDIEAQKGTWEGFMKVTLWSSFMIVLVLAYAIFTITMGMDWMVALGLLTVVGVAGGLFMGMGSAWIACVIALVGLAVFLQIMIWFAGILI